MQGFFCCYANAKILYKKLKKLKWQNPLELAYSIAIDTNYKENWVFLYSGLNDAVKDSCSYLAIYPKKEIIADDFTEFKQQLSEKNSSSTNQWFGYLSYNLKNKIEELSQDQPSFINLPDLWMVNFNIILVFNHNKKQISCYYSHPQFLDKIPQIKTPKINNKKILNSNFEIDKIKSNFSKKDYLQKVDYIRQRIKEGDFYQANLTRKFFGQFNQNNIHPFILFLKLNQSSPANYSAFLKLKDNTIISSSPELFLKIDPDKQVISSPIKGTAPRSKDFKLDQINKNTLRNSSKEKAENLMIVDLVRNDLSKSCIAGSVKVKNLFKIESYKTIHHMSSDIYAIKDDKSSTLQLVKGCFPPGSMTGTPKIKAMEICSQLEQNRRGVYGGAIGFFDGNNHSCNLSVVIRTLIIQNNKFEFQVGGAITFDSKAISEWDETINKSKGIAQSLGIKLSDLRSI